MTRPSLPRLSSFIGLQEGMGAWTAWGDKVGTRMVEFGTPRARRTCLAGGHRRLNQ